MVDAVRMQERPVYLDVIPGYTSDHLLLSRIPRECRVSVGLRKKAITFKLLTTQNPGLTTMHMYP